MMDTDETVKLLTDGEFLKKLYGYAYRRCATTVEAEDLCSEIVLAVLKAIQRAEHIENFYAFTWKVASRVYADFCQTRKHSMEVMIPDGFSDEVVNLWYDPMDSYIEEKAQEDQLNRILREISFLSESYRSVMVMYYIDEMKISDIAREIGISETAVKQRLFSARNRIKKEATKMDVKNLTLKPVGFICHGSGNPNKSYPFSLTTRAFSQNLIYLCKEQARSAREISEILHVPMPFVEDELHIQENGTNGTDGLLKRLKNGKYISTFPMIDYNDYKEIRGMIQQYIGRFTDKIERYAAENKERILSFPFLNAQTDLRFILWSLVNRMCWYFGWSLSDAIMARYYPDIDLDQKDYYPFVFAYDPSSACTIHAMGCDGVDAEDVGRYSHVHLCNIYDRDRKEAHFHCGLNVHDTPYILLTLRAVGGLDVQKLSDTDKATAAEAIENGFLKKEGNILTPKILVLDERDSAAFYSLASDFRPYSLEFAEDLAEDFNKLIVKYLPNHLYGQVNQFISQVTADFDYDVITSCIERGILYPLKRKICAEGTFMVVTPK